MTNNDDLRQRGNEWAMGLLNSRRDAARWNMLAGGAVLTVAASVAQLADTRSTRLFAAVGLGLSLACLVKVVLCWRRAVKPGNAESEAAPWMSGIERDILPTLRAQGDALAAEFVLLAITLTGILVIKAVT